MSAKSLKLNEAKAEIMMFGKSSQAFLPDARGRLASNVRPSVENLGVIFNGVFEFQEQVSAVVRRAYYHLKTLAEADPCLHHVTTGLL